MRFNFISKDSDGLGFALRIAQERNPVRFFSSSKDGSEIGDGFDEIEKVGDLESLLKDAERESDIFIFDSSGSGFTADYIKSLGYATLGGSRLADELEKDRAYGLGVMENSGIKIPKTKSFNDWDEARSFAEKFEGRLVYKPSNKLGDFTSSYAASDGEDMVEYLTLQENLSNIKNPEFELQTFMDGNEVSTECWFDGRDFLPLFNHTLERKHLMNDDQGPSGGCTGNIVWACDGDCEVCELTVKKLRDFLRSEKFIGPIDVNAILTEGEAYGLEFTPRFGYDASPTLLFELLDGEIGQLFADISRQEYSLRDSPVLSHGKFAAGLRVSIPPWPSEDFLAPKGVPLRGLDSQDLKKRVYLFNVKKDLEKNLLQSAGAWGALLVATGSATSIAGAFKKPYEIADKLKVPNKQYRTDFVEVFKERLSRIDAFGIVVRIAGA